MLVCYNDFIVFIKTQLHFRNPFSRHHTHYTVWPLWLLLYIHASRQRNFFCFLPLATYMCVPYAVEHQCCIENPKLIFWIHSVSLCRYKPFFPFQVQPPLGSVCDLDLSVQESRLVEGRLKVTLIECSRWDTFFFISWHICLDIYVIWSETLLVGLPVGS